VKKVDSPVSLNSPETASCREYITKGHPIVIHPDDPVQTAGFRLDLAKPENIFVVVVPGQGGLAPERLPTFIVRGCSQEFDDQIPAKSWLIPKFKGNL
jgi:hypothetical protein